MAQDEHDIRHEEKWAEKIAFMRANPTEDWTEDERESAGLCLTANCANRSTASGYCAECSSPHKHECEHDHKPLIAGLQNLCEHRGFHRCSCGAERNIHGEWSGGLFAGRT